MFDLKNALGQLALTQITDRRFGEKREVGFAEAFEQSRRDIGAAYQLGNEIRGISKRGMVALKKGDHQEVESCRRQLSELWERLGKLNLPQDLVWRFDAENGQEMVEFFFVAVLYPYLYPETAADDAPSFPTINDLQVTPQSWLAGVGDSVSELGKIHLDILAEEDSPDVEKIIAMRKRYLAIAKQMHGFLDQFESAYAMVIDNNRFRGYGNGFRGLLLRLSRLIEHETQDLVLLLNFRAVINEGMAKMVAVVEAAAERGAKKAIDKDGLTANA